MSLPEGTSARRVHIVGQGRETRVAVSLTPEEIATLVRVADYYNRNWGPFRHVVRALSGREMRARFRLVSEEGHWLQEFLRAETENQDATSHVTLTFTPLALIAFWGRLLSSLNSPRARRKLTRDERDRRREMTELFEGAARTVGLRDPQLIASQIGTRRVSEQGWMREALSGLEVREA